ncbi:MAG: hypothetical protein AAGU21_18745 [Solidesulfovibrio sp.]|uniref:hypothetical protein n=1 Tax=Solidesulfovibrio sp. TaxID=2910990 RepID=UPI003158261B
MKKRNFLSYEDLDRYYPFIAAMEKSLGLKDNFLVENISKKRIEAIHPGGDTDFDIGLFLKVLRFRRSSFDAFFTKLFQTLINKITDRPKIGGMSFDEEREGDDNSKKDKLTFEAMIEWLKIDEEPSTTNSMEEWLIDKYTKPITYIYQSEQHRGRKQKLSDMECLRLYRLHYSGDRPSIAKIANEYNWKDSPYMDTTSDNTKRDRIKKAIIRGRAQTPPRDRPLSDKTGRD